MQNFLRSTRNKLLEIFFPEICFGCEKAGKMLCEECEEMIKNNKRKKTNLENISWVYSGLNYQNHILQKIFYAFKYSHTKSLSKYLAKLVEKDFVDFLKKVLEESGSEYKNLIFIPIPISKKRKIERDYNQSEILLEEIIKIIKEKENLNLQTQNSLDFLLKTKHTIKFASTHSRDEREKLIKNVFSINPKYSKEFTKDKIFILLDDITTTGTTFYEARKNLMDFGIPKNNIYAYALAH